MEIDPGGSISIGNHPDIAKGLLVIGNDSIKGLSTLMDLAREVRRGGLPDRDTFVLDTTSTLATTHLREIVRSDSADSKTGFSGRKAEIQHYGTLTTDMQDFYLEWCDLPRNVIFVCHDLDEQDELTKQWTTRIAHTPKLAETVLTLMDAMLYLTANYPMTASKPPERTVRAMPTNRIRAKTRLGIPATFPAEQLWDHVKLGSTAKKETTNQPNKGTN